MSQITFLAGNLFRSNANTLVNTVNCKGVMGKGIALAFKQKYPQMFEDYRSRCNAGSVHPGEPYCFHVDSIIDPVLILNFPTKDDWRGRSKRSYIEQGLNWFRKNYEKEGIKSVAFPPLGCGNGGLSWDDIGPLMYEKLYDLPIDIEVYVPSGTDPDQPKKTYEKKIAAAQSTDTAKAIIPFNKYWLLVLHVVRMQNKGAHTADIGDTLFPFVSYICTRAGMQTGLQFIKKPSEKSVSPMLKELLCSPYFTREPDRAKKESKFFVKDEIPLHLFTDTEIEMAKRSAALLRSVKNKEQADVFTSVLFSYDRLRKQNKPVSTNVLLHSLPKKLQELDRVKEVTEVMQFLCLNGWIDLAYESDDPNAFTDEDVE